YFAERRLGANDGARALRQPGSTLKPFVYAAAMERFGWTSATLVSDLGLELSTPEGTYVPRNYDGREHGPVRLRVALANSLNLPALRAAAQVGPSNVMSMLERFGFDSLDRDPDHYGAAIALGDGEVRLTELAAAYAALARDGEWRPLRFVRAARDANGRSHTFSREPAKRVLSAGIARQLTSILADERARRPSFGADSVLSFAFPAAAKTGTSKGFRDNWAVGYTRELTVAVWAGNFDGRPMVQSSGVSGAGPVFHAVLERAMRGRRAAPLVESTGFVEREICPLSGALPASACPHRVREHFLPDAVPRGECRFHERVLVDAATGERTSERSARAEIRSFERYFDAATRWAQEAGRPVAPTPVLRNGR
ncbi:MAG TPA: penicillin-binding transpeptidase domain-containing protein, partial [Polyangiaceae bacterium]